MVHWDEPSVGSRMWVNMALSMGNPLPNYCAAHAGSIVENARRGLPFSAVAENTTVRFWAFAAGWAHAPCRVDQAAFRQPSG
ncbi:protein of unknown function (plasmid) [Ralstonia solanacearum PSI07]|uniref:Uncharacterized protein n=1 Tax=blood disease bacterium A2-HR MARDI TaxID=1944648 RepID=A0A1U9VLM2_9RALS|nr:hypothetical protein B0B51_15165 [blood disease bacterium A2-HR MARDI]CBM10591.1 protein of unknown function [Ralstonia solanacearum PSI07]